MKKCYYYWMPDESHPPTFASWFWDTDRDADHGPQAHGPFPTRDAAKADRARYLSETTGNTELER
jgi:hypothetical protein